MSSQKRDAFSTEEGMDEKRTKQLLSNNSEKTLTQDLVLPKEDEKMEEEVLSYDSNSVIDFHQGIWLFEW